VDRWYGQTLSSEQISTLLVYYRETPIYMVPLWMHGLLYLLRGQNYVEHLHFPWDYDICSDISWLQGFRRGPVPFDYMPSLWKSLHKRDALLELEQEGLSKSESKYHKGVWDVPEARTENVTRVEEKRMRSDAAP